VGRRATVKGRKHGTVPVAVMNKPGVRFIQEDLMQKKMALISGAFLGVGFVFALTTKRGKQIRKEARRQLTNGVEKAGKAIKGTAEDFGYTWRGYIDGIKTAVNQAKDEVLAERVFATVVCHAINPEAIKIEVLDGMVLLSGDVAAFELDSLLEAVKNVHGVKYVENWLQVHSRFSDRSDENELVSMAMAP